MISLRSMIDFTEQENSIIFTVRVVPRASKSEVIGDFGGALKVKLKSPPIDGAANAELTKILAEFFAIPKSAVEIFAGQTSKTKKVKIRGSDQKILPAIDLLKTL